MSQAQAKNDKMNYYPKSSKPQFKRGKEKGKYFYQSQFPYYNAPFNFQPPWKFFHWRKPPFRRRRNAPPENDPPRSPSPFSGTEEYTLKKIQEASDMIKKQLMMPEITDSKVDSTNKSPPVEPPAKSDEPLNDKKSDKCENEKNMAKTNKKQVQYDVGEIHHKIVTHITNLNHGKKMNLICATSSGYDEAIQQIQKQKRLELSKVFRDMCSNQTVDNSDVINSIIPDIGIKIEELPLEVIQELSSTLDMNFEDTFCQSDSSDIVKIKTEICESGEFASTYPSVDVDVSIVKTEEDCCNDGTDCPMDANFIPNITPKVEEMEDSNIQCDAACQTDPPEWSSSSTQTDFDSGRFQVNTDISNLDEAIKSMLTIDKEITRLTKLRQSIFLKLQNSNSQNGLKNKKNNDKVTVSEKNVKDTKIQPKEPKDEHLYKKELNFGDISEKILVMEVIKDTLLVGSESGKIFCINLENGTTSGIIEIEDYPITSFCIWNIKKRPHLFVGSFETRIREYNFNTRSLIRLSHIGESVQCMELAWNFIFIGSMNGSLMRYSLALNKVEFEDKISKDRILVLKATQEGARKVLLVGTRNSPVCIRDAMSGLHMRTMNEIVAPTVYSLLLENSLVYCGTTFHDILVFSFHDGNLVRKYQASNSKGIGCMKIVDNLLYASCHNGNVYVYNVKTRQYVGVIEGPGGVILSMEIFKNIVIVGTMSFHFKSMLIPEYILESNRSAFEL